MADSKILDLLPPYWRNHEVMRAFANSVGQPFDKWRTIIGSLYRYFDPFAAPSSWLSGLSQLVGLPRLDYLTETQRRNLIAAAFETWTWKGTERGIEAYLQAVTGTPANVVRTATTAFIAGVSIAGDACGPGVLGWTFDVEVPTSAGLSESTIRSILDPVVSSLETYTVTFT